MTRAGAHSSDAVKAVVASLVSVGNPCFSSFKLDPCPCPEELLIREIHEETVDLFEIEMSVDCVHPMERVVCCFSLKSADYANNCYGVIDAKQSGVQA